MYYNRREFECLEDPKSKNRSMVDVKLQSSPDSKILWKSDPETLDELKRRKESCINKKQTSASPCPVEDSTFSSVKKLREMMTRPRKLDTHRFASLIRIFRGN